MNNIKPLRFPPPVEKRHVLHMLSGGRDSFLAAALLAEQGYKLELVTFDNGHIDGIGRVSAAASCLKGRYPEVTISHIIPVKIGMTLHSYMANEWYRKSKERQKLFPELQSYQAHCLSCRTAMYVHAIAYCAAHHVPFLSEGARKHQGFFVELPEMKERYEQLCLQNGIHLLWPVYGLKSDMDRKRFLDERGLPTKTLEPQCYLGCPMGNPLTAEERRDLTRFFDLELLPQLQRDIESLIAVKASGCVGMTNADKIRGMSDEELSDFLDKVHDFPCEACCNNLSRCRRNNAPEPICKNHFLDWLKGNVIRCGECGARM